MRGQMIPAMRNGIEISLRFLENVVQISEKIKIYSVYFAMFASISTDSTSLLKTDHRNPSCR